MSKFEKTQKKKDTVKALRDAVNSTQKNPNKQHVGKPRQIKIAL